MLLSSAETGALAGVVAVSLIPLVPILLPGAERRIRRALPFLVSFAAGTLLGSATLRLLPTAARQLGNDQTTGILLIAGFMGFLVLEAFLWTHHHDGHGPEGRPTPVATLNVIGDGIHNFIDGAIIAASFTIDPSVGMATVIAVAFHEIPQEIGDFAILLHAGVPFRRAVALNLLSGLAAVAGGAVTLLAGRREPVNLAVLLPIAAGGFLYIAAVDLVPRLERDRGVGRLLIHVGLMMVGVLIFLVPV